MLSQLRFPRQVYLLCFGALVNRAGSFLLPFLTLYVVEALGYSAAVAALAIGLHGLGAIVAALVGGSLTDLIGRRPVQLWSMFGAAALLLVLWRVQSIGMLLAVVLVFAVVSNAYRPAVAAMIADVVPAERRPHAYALLYQSINLGFSIAALLGGWLAARSWAWLFWGDALTCAAYGVVIVVAIQETRPVAMDPPEHTAQPAPSGKLPARPWTRVLSDRTFMLFCLAAIVPAALFIQAMSTFPLYLHDLGFDAQIYGRVIAVNGVMIVLLQLPITSWIARYPQGRMLVLAAAITASGFALKAVVSHVAPFVLTVVIWTVGEIMLASLQPTVVAQLAPQDLRGRYLGLFNTLFGLATVLSGPLGGVIYQAYGGRALFAGCGAAGLVAVALYALLARRLMGNTPSTR